MKKQYQMPQIEIVVYSSKLMQDIASSGEVPGGGSGTPDSRRYNGGWDEGEDSNNSRKRTVWDNEEEEL